MKLTRHFFIGGDLDDLERLEEDLERAGVPTPQIHLLTLDDGAADHRHHLHQVSALMKKDIIHSTLVGAAVGVCAAAVTLVLAYFSGWTDTAAGWWPFIFLAIVMLGFFTWEGGLRGIDTPNMRFQRFEKALKDGKHVFFVDLEPEQGRILESVATGYPAVEPAGTGPAAPHWVVLWQHRLKRFFAESFP